ncbi:protein SLOW GREEN 1 [Carex littledalei]|uniref:Protein SLOW GREEN 1 n=1 Tax=Carex littledalei TaxID=544730 RepID=A0A833RR06_9POAL|nr:protein SLOW GREEN 1 [Carex littledalei]
MDYLVGAAPIPSQRLLPSISRPLRKSKHLPVIASSSSKTPNTLLLTLRTTISSAVLLTATSAALLSGKALADPSIPPPSTVETIPLSESPESKSETSTLSQLLDSNEQLSDDLRKIIYTKIDTASYDEEKLSLLCKVISSRPSEIEWKISAAMLLSDKHEIAKARKILEEVLSQEPLSLDALREYAILMDLAKDYSAVYKRLEEAMEIANGENKKKEVRGIRFIKAWMLIFQHKLEEALKSLEELRIEDTEDYRSYFALGVVYSLMDKSKEAKEVFQKLKDLSGSNIEVETVLKNGRLGMVVFRTEEKVHKVEFRVFSYDGIDR